MEIKNHGVYKFSAWMNELRREKENAAADTAAVVVKPKGVGATKVFEWWVVMTLEDYTGLLTQAGYGPHEEHLDESQRSELRL